jgi:streptomycin 6-kinase
MRLVSMSTDQSENQLWLAGSFRRRVEGAFGAAGVAWLARLPALVAHCAARWSLTLEPPFGLSYNYVAPARRPDGSPVVLELGCPNPDWETEIAALRAFGGERVCRLLEADSALGAILLERVLPGTPLTSVALDAEDDADERATAIAISVMRGLWRPPPEGHQFPSVADWARGLGALRRRFDGDTGPLPARLVEEAEACFAWLLATTTDPRLLHGDLHHGNILSATRVPWLVIEPKGIDGDPGYDLGAFLGNPWPGLLPHPNPRRLLARRVDQLSEGLAMERVRVRGWGLAQAVLSAWWCIDDGIDWRHSIACAEYLSALPASQAAPRDTARPPEAGRAVLDEPLDSPPAGGSTVAQGQLRRRSTTE